MVEFALILPLLLFIIFAIIDFGRVMVIYAGISNGAREAVRYGAVPGTRADSSYNYMDCEVMRQAAREAVPLMTLTDDQIWVGFDQGSGAPASPSYNCGEVTAAQIVQGDRIVAWVHADIELITPLVSNIWPSVPLDFTAARTIIKDGVQTGPTSLPPSTRTSLPPTPTATDVGGGSCHINPHDCTATAEAALSATATRTRTPGGPAPTNTATHPPITPSDTPRPTSTWTPSVTPTPRYTATRTPLPTPTCPSLGDACRQTRTAWATAMTATNLP